MRLKFKSHLSNQLGLSLIEGLVSVGAVAGLAGLIASLSTQVDTNQYGLQRSCESLAQSILESVADEGVYSDLYTVNPGFAAITSTLTGETILSAAQGVALSSGGSAIDFVSNADLWPATTTIVGSGARPVMNTHKLIKGNMRALNAIYNGAIDVCTGGPVAYPQITNTSATEVVNLGLTSELFSLNAAPVITIQLQTVDENGRAGCEATPLEIVPSHEGSSGAPAAWDAASFTAIDGTNGITQPPPNVRDDLGYKLSVFINYDFKNDGNLESCNSSQTFRYAIDDTPPATPDVAEVVSRVPAIGALTELSNAAFLCEPPGTNDALRQITVRVGYSAGREPGVVLLCRDTSQHMNRDIDGGVIDRPERVYNNLTDPNVPGPDLLNRSCQIAAGPNNKYVINPNTENSPELSSVFRDVESPAEWADEVLGVASPDNLDRWVPCHELRICGREDTTGGAVTITAPAAWDTQSADYTVEMTYTNLPTDCIVGLDVVAIDPSGNVSGIRQLEDNFAKAGPWENPDGIGNADSLNSAQALGSSRIFHRGFCGTPGQGAAQENMGTHGFVGPIKTNGLYVPGLGYWCRPPGWRATGQTVEIDAVIALGDAPLGNPDFYYSPDINGPVPLDIFTAGGITVSTSESRQWNWEDVPEGGEDQTITGTSQWDGSTWPPGVPPAEWGSVSHESTDDGSTGGNGNYSWIDEFPNGYYTCRPTGCCVDAPGSSTCTPFSF